MSNQPTFCPECDDGDGCCAYPFYGAVPHGNAPVTPTHPMDWLVVTLPLPADQWPANFVVDPEDRKAGTYTHCLACGAGREGVSGG